MHSPSLPQPKRRGSYPRICWPRTTQISFNQGVNGVWYFMRSTSLAHKPKTYQSLSAYFEPCVSDSFSHFADGMACWQNPNLERGIYPIPLVGVNFTYLTQLPNGEFGIPPRSVFIHPSSSELAVIAWKSPITGLVNVAGLFSDLDPTAGNGIIWSPFWIIAWIETIFMEFRGPKAL